jgi:2-hydroxy-3-oxopropionate reductase
MGEGGGAVREVAFLGLGLMGRPMAANLARAGFAVRAWNRTVRDWSDLQALGIGICARPEEAVAGAGAVSLCLLDAAASEAVLSRVLPALEPGCIVLDHGTVGVDAARRLAAAAEARGARYLDAPVSGGVPGALAGTLTIMAGGEPAAFNEALPLLQAMGRLVCYMGPTGSGQAAKLVNQLLTAVHSAAAAEALNLGMRFRLDPDALYTVLAASYGASRMLERTLPVLKERRFESTFKTDVLQKDLGLVLAMSREAGAAVPLAALASDLCRRLQERGWGQKDVAALADLLNEAGLLSGEA